MLVVRTWIVACQSMTVAEYVVAALCLISQLKLALLVNQGECIFSVQCAFWIFAAHDGTSANLVEVLLGIGIVAKLGKSLSTVEIDLAQTADDRRVELRVLALARALHDVELWILTVYCDVVVEHTLIGLATVVDGIVLCCSVNHCKVV